MADTLQVLKSKLRSAERHGFTLRAEELKAKIEELEPKKKAAKKAPAKKAAAKKAPAKKAAAKKS